MDLLLTNQILNIKLTLFIQSYCKKLHHSNLLLKIDFIEKTCPKYDLTLAVASFCFLSVCVTFEPRFCHWSLKTMTHCFARFLD